MPFSVKSPFTKNNVKNDLYLQTFIQQAFFPLTWRVFNQHQHVSEWSKWKRALLSTRKLKDCIIHHFLRGQRVIRAFTYIDKSRLPSLINIPTCCCRLFDTVKWKIWFINLTYTQKNWDESEWWNQSLTKFRAMRCRSTTRRHEETVEDEERAENYTFAFSSSSSSYCSGFSFSTLSEMWNKRGSELLFLFQFEKNSGYSAAVVVRKKDTLIKREREAASQFWRWNDERMDKKFIKNNNLSH